MSAFENAAFNTVHDYSRGAKALAEIVDIPYHVLLHKVNPNNETHQLSVRQAVKIMQATGDDRMLHAIAAELGMVLVITQMAEIDDRQMHQAMTQALGRFGEYLDTVSESLEDGRITATELRKIDGTLGKMIEKVTVIRAIAAQMAESRRAGR
ncbi:MAG: hypothetical protein ABS43_01700 [Bordetella sp. SCN 67-23]|nr:phage regulatory CII family protein [Burkholderiales bacterium]ODS76286.1 MAG: hypothetical protein ABS43_01700 [Bordetella sp. SCN 67-23]OJW90089.1 MAG: hypothetical protein BGO71_27635 [Burkholderiales bacterium 67-32]